MASVASGLKPSPYRGGGGRLISDAEPDRDYPQHALDVALAQAVLRTFSRARAMAAYARGELYAPKVAGINKFARQMSRDLSRNPWVTLSPGVRAGLERCLKPEKLAAVMAAAKVAAGVGRDMPECLWPENLPKKPPGRK